MIFIAGGLFIFSIRVDSYDPAGLGYSDKCVELEKTGKWSLVLKEKRELHATPNEEKYRDCYLITYKILKWAVQVENTSRQGGRSLYNGQANIQSEA